MKKQLLKIAAFSAAVVISGSVFGQWTQKTLDFNSTATPPTIDGITEDWADVEAQAIDQVWKPGDANEETVSFGDLGATFKAVWDSKNIYLLIEVDDDNHWNHVDAEVNSWQADKPEVYLDVNETLIDGVGPSVSGSGHYQVTPDFGPAPETPHFFQSAYIVDALGPYAYEYAIPVDSLLDKEGAAFVAVDGAVLGFDITILDLDEPGSGAGNEEGMGRINWCNDVLTEVEGSVTDESWTSMDMAGVITLKGATAISNSTINNNMVYPNVASDMIVVNAEAAQYEIINSLGQVVMVSEVNEFSVASLETGVYFVKANDQVARILKK